MKLMGLVLIGLLFFIWPVPHTATARDFLLLLNLVLFTYLAWRKGVSREAVRELSVPIIILVVLTAWMYFVAIFVSPETVWSFSEIQSQWWRALVAMFIGACVAHAAKDNPGFRRRIWLVLFSVLMLHILYVDFLGAREWLAAGPDERVEGLTGGPDMSSYLTNILFGFLLAEAFCRAAHRVRAIPIPDGLLAGALGLTLASVFAERTRNAIITLVLMLIVWGVLYLSAQKGRLKRSLAMTVAGTMVLVSLGGLGLIAKARDSSSLDNLFETVSVAWDTEHYKAWQDGGQEGWPKLSDGETVDPSGYLRIAWFKEGLKLVRDHPLGIGYGRSAFGHGIKAKYGISIDYSHSGLLDIMIGIGIPGALLWVTFLASLMSLAYRRFRYGEASSYAAVLLFFLVLDHGARLLLDSIQRDHILQQFCFLVGLAAVTMASASRLTAVSMEKVTHDG
jgi:hypothetical protein